MGAPQWQLNRTHLRFARAGAYIRRMDAKFWERALKEAERELEAATRLADVNAAARKLVRAEALKRRQQRPASSPLIKHHRAA